MKKQSSGILRARRVLLGQCLRELESISGRMATELMENLLLRIIISQFVPSRSIKWS